MNHLFKNLVFVIVLFSASAICEEIQRKQTRQNRARDLGISFEGTPGKLNAITDVPGVLVGHETIIKGEGELIVGRGPIRTGVTAILPTGKSFRKIFASGGKLNGNGEFTGMHWVEESGMLEEPILFTNTHSIGAAHQAAIKWRQENKYHNGKSKYDFASLPVIGETWDGRLNDIHGFHVKEKHVLKALNNASGGAILEGNVGGGTGMVCFKFKGGIGTSSRITEDGFVLGALVQANFGSREDLKISGKKVGKEIPDLNPVMNSILPSEPGNSILVVIGTNAPLLPHQLKRLTNRIPLGIQRTGGVGYNSSGDLFITFSTAPLEKRKNGKLALNMIPNEKIDQFFKAVIQTTEESIINALVAARSMTGINGNHVYELPESKIKKLFNP